jgi:hypothetical protein
MKHVGWSARTLLFGLLLLLAGAAWAAPPAGYWSFAGDTLWRFTPIPADPDETHAQVSGGGFSLLYTLHYYDRNGTKQTLTDASNIQCSFDGLDLQYQNSPGAEVPRRRLPFPAEPIVSSIRIQGHGHRTRSRVDAATCS